MVRLLLTHGRGLHGRDSDRLRAKFTRYLQQGLAQAGYPAFDDDRIDFLYYGDILDRAMRAAGDPLMTPVMAVEREVGATGDGRAFDADLDALHRRLHEAGTADARVGSMVEERAFREASVTADTDADRRRAAMDTAIDERADQLQDNPAELLDVLERQFGPAYADDDTVRSGLQGLNARLGDHPRESAARKAAEEEETDDPGRVESLLREWIVDPVTDAIAGLEAVRRIADTYGVDLRTRLAAWGETTWSEVLTRFEQTDFGQQWAMMFDVLAIIASKTMLDGFYIARTMVDVEQFLRDDAIRFEVRRYFHDALNGRDVPTIVIAHSLGSVIAYDVLREFPGLSVPGLVTLGSPLSIGHFRRNLAREGESGDNLPVPRELAAWVNVYSELDPLILGSGIERYFAGGGVEAGPGPVDQEAENHGYLDAHSPDQYLQAQATAGALIRMIAHARVLASAR